MQPRTSKGVAIQTTLHPLSSSRSKIQAWLLDTRPPQGGKKRKEGCVAQPKLPWNRLYLLSIALAGSYVVGGKSAASARGRIPLMHGMNGLKGLRNAPSLPAGGLECLG